MNEKDTHTEDDKMARGFKRLHEMKSSKKTGKVIFYLDGTGKVREVEVSEKVQ